MNNDQSFEIIKFGAAIEEANRGWNLEINLVSWFGKEPKWDIRSWNEDHTKCGKGILLSNEALQNLVKFVSMEGLNIES